MSRRRRRERRTTAPLLLSSFEHSKEKEGTIEHFRLSLDYEYSRTFGLLLFGLNLLLSAVDEEKTVLDNQGFSFSLFFLSKTNAM